MTMTTTSALNMENTQIFWSKWRGKQIKNGNNVISVRNDAQQNQQQMLKFFGLVLLLLLFVFGLFRKICDYIELQRRTCCHIHWWASFVSLSSFQLISDFTFKICTRTRSQADCVHLRRHFSQFIITVMIRIIDGVLGVVVVIVVGTFFVFHNLWRICTDE